MIFATELHETRSWNEARQYAPFFDRDHRIAIRVDNEGWASDLRGGFL
jgi:hypothetical protein